MIRYKGYTAIMEIDDEAGVIHGRVSGLRDVITFEGDSVTGAIQAFRDSVDDYLEWCAEDGRPPERPFSGKLLVRIDPVIHRGLAQLAEARATSVNALVGAALEELASTASSGAKAPRKQAPSTPPGRTARKRVRRGGRGDVAAV
jgi:predicted HicB family RNase H-like nuclease